MLSKITLSHGSHNSHFYCRLSPQCTLQSKLIFYLRHCCYAPTIYNRQLAKYINYTIYDSFASTASRHRENPLAGQLASRTLSSLTLLLIFYKYLTYNFLGIYPELEDMRQWKQLILTCAVVAFVLYCAGITDHPGVAAQYEAERKGNKEDVALITQARCLVTSEKKRKEKKKFEA